MSLSSQLSTCLRGILLLACAACLLSSCRVKLEESVMRDRMGSAILKRKTSVDKWWDEHRIGSEKPEYYLKNRKALLSNPDQAFIVQTGQNTFRINLKGNWQMTMGSAIPITEDGYFLTASHCDQTDLFVWHMNLTPGQVKHRVVWRGDVTKGEPDLAVLHARVRPPALVPLAPPDDLPKGTRVLTSGEAPGRVNASAGKVRSITDWHLSPSGIRWREMVHTARISPGDSGGPVIDANGRLVAVNSSVSGRLYHFAGRDFLQGYEGHASYMMPDDLWEIINRDRKRQSGRL